MEDGLPPECGDQYCLLLGVQKIVIFFSFPFLTQRSHLNIWFTKAFAKWFSCFNFDPSFLLLICPLTSTWSSKSSTFDFKVSLTSKLDDDVACLFSGKNKDFWETPTHTWRITRYCVDLCQKYEHLLSLLFALQPKRVLVELPKDRRATCKVMSRTLSS